jgi:hypothetical protein
VTTEELLLEQGHGVGDRFDILTPAAPAAGANYSFTVGSRNVAALRVLSAIATLATDSTAANRLFALDYILGRGTTVIRHAPTLLVTASTSATVFQWDTAHSVSEWSSSTPVFVPLNAYWLTPGWTIQLTVDSKQAGDAITAISFYVEYLYADS